MFKKIIKVYQSQDKISLYALIISIIAIIVMLTLFGLNFSELPHQIPMFYSMPWGEEQLGSLIQYLVLPFLALLSILMNVIISWHLHNSQLVLKRTLSLSTAAVSILFLVTALKIVTIFT